MCQEAERATEGEPVNFEVIDSKATEQERETDEDPNSDEEPEGDMQAECERQTETQTEDPCASTSAGPSGLWRQKHICLKRGCACVYLKERAALWIMQFN